MGYTLDEIVGRKHAIFIDPVVVASEAYGDFWADLAGGTFKSASFVRYGKGGKEVWLQATYNPVLDESGAVVSVIKVASDVTMQKRGELEVRDRTQAVVEFLPDGTILGANRLFLDVVGYSLEEVRGRHDAMFVAPDEASGAAYTALWASLARGDFQEGRFQRISNDGGAVHFQGAYSPVFDAEGQIASVTMAVVNVTEDVEAKRRADEIGSQMASNLADMEAALHEISSRVSGTAGLAQSAESDAHNATDVVKQLDHSSESIGRVVTVIQRLSEQTNLLALNATIEAARAGESGRGFAVVANEVKLLSNQTGGATEDIRDNIEAIQSNVATVVAAIQGIVDRVAEVSSNTHTVVAAVEEQTQVMTQMSDTARELLTVSSSA